MPIRDVEFSCFLEHAEWPDGISATNVMIIERFRADWLWPGDGGAIYCNQSSISSSQPLLSAEVMLHVIHRPALLPLKMFETQEMLSFSTQKLADGSIRWIRGLPGH